MNNSDFVYSGDKIEQWRSFDYPDYIQAYLMQSDVLLVSFSFRDMNKSCVPFVVYDNVLYAAGPMTITKSGSSSTREYYKTEFEDWPYLKDALAYRTIYDYDVRNSNIDKVLSSVGQITNLSVSSMLRGKLAVLDASKMDGCWYISRVNVPEGCRMQGVGSRMVRAALSEMIRDGFCEIVVTPGGYGSKKKLLENFYSKCGFISQGDPERSRMRYYYKP